MKLKLLGLCLLFLLSCAFLVNVKAYEYVLVDGDTDTTNMGANSLKNEHPSGNADDSAIGQAITANDTYTLGHIEFYMDKIGSPTSNLVCAIYNVSGTPGVDGVPDGNSALVYSSLVSATTLPASPNSQWVSFNFTSSWFPIVNQTDYAISVEANTSNVDAINLVRLRIDGNAGHMGNRFKYDNGAWANISLSYDLLFRVYRVDDTTNPMIEYFGFNSTLNGSVSEFTFNFSSVYELSHFVYGWNNSGIWINTTYSLSGTDNQTIVNYTLNATDGVKIEYRVWVNDTFNNWGSNSLSFFYTNTEPIIVIGEGYLIMGVFFLVGVFCIIGYIAYSKH